MTLPRYLEIGERLTREIGAGLRPDGARLPTEAVLAREMGVSARTLRKALAELTARGLLVRRQGSGNYVRQSARPVGIYGFLHLELACGGGMPTWIARVEDRIGPGRVPDWANAGFPLAAGAVCGHVARRAESRERRVEELSRTWFDPDAAAYLARWSEA